MPYEIPVNNKFSCLPASFSMVCGVPFKKFIELLGHDGSATPFKSTSDKQAFHIQECLDVAWKLGFICMPIDLFCISSPTADGSQGVFKIWDQDAAAARFLQYLKGRAGVMEGASFRSQGVLRGHAVAWDGEKIYDPRGRSYSMEDRQSNNFTPSRFWLMEKRHEATQDI
ncbi:MAG: hypothetical protein AMXMBFR16_10800 [Candidatus Uhrbacteria bacterium]